jgi:hypothetical protein
MNEPPSAWLWQEIVARFGVDAAGALYQDWLSYSRSYHRAKDDSPLHANQPKQRPGKPSAYPIYDILNEKR